MSFLTKVRNIFIRINQNIDVRLKNYNIKTKETSNDEIIILNTAIGSDNLGDEIILYYYSKAISDVVETDKLYNIATHNKLSDEDIERLLKSKYAIIVGTNILSPQMELYSGWKFDNRLIKLRNVVLVGVGWWGYKKPSIYSRYVYRNILTKKIIHSVRDEQTLTMLKSIGITNVVNTNCLTMLGLDEICKKIPTKKSDEVIFTVTGVSKKYKKDKDMIQILRKNYRKLYFWPQGDVDLEYLESINECYNVEILERSLSAYTSFINKNKNLDYVGTRLHGGIHAMQNGKRTIIIAVDNRAIEISNNTGLPVICDDEINEKLEKMINGEWETHINLNKKEIEKWHNSFKNAIS